MDFDEACKALSQAGHKRTEIKRTLIGIKNSAQKGFLLERKADYRVPNAVTSSNAVAGHSHISKEVMMNQHKGSLYSECGRICHELTSTYPLLDSFKMTTIL